MAQTPPVPSSRVAIGSRRPSLLVRVLVWAGVALFLGLLGHALIRPLKSVGHVRAAGYEFVIAQRIPPGYALRLGWVEHYSTWVWVRRADGSVAAFSVYPAPRQRWREVSHAVSGSDYVFAARSGGSSVGTILRYKYGADVLCAPSGAPYASFESKSDVWPPRLNDSLDLEGKTFYSRTLIRVLGWYM